MESFVVNNDNLEINGTPLQKVKEYSIKKSSCEDKMTVTVVFDVDIVDINDEENIKEE